MLTPNRSALHRSTRGLAALTAAVAAVLAGSASAATITLNDGESKLYTPAATGAAGAVDTRTYTGQNQNDSSLINFAGTANSVTTDTDLTVAAQPSNTATQFLGGLNITTGGTYTFGLNTDDGSRLFIDGVLIVNNEGGHGATNLTRAITLEAGRHEIRVDYVNNSGGGSIAVTYAGPDQLVSGPIPSANLFRAENTVSTTVAPHTTTALGDDIAITAGATATIGLNGTAYANAGLNSLNFGAGATLNLNGTANRDLRFGSTVFNGASTYTINNPLGDISLGVSTGTAASATIVKQGAGRLILDNTSATANDFTGATFDVQGGTLYAIGRNATGATNPLGSAIVQLNGGTLALDTSLGDVSFNNQITLAGTGGTIEAVSGPRTMTLSNTTAIALNAGQTLNLHTLGGSNNAAGGIVVLNAPLTGAGSLTKTETRAGSGTGLGIAALAGDSTGYSGAITVEGGVLEGRFATVGAQPFGTNPGIAVNAGAGLNFRAGNATSNLTYNVGKNVNAAGNIVLSADRYTGTATGSTFALGALALSGPGTITMNSGNGHNIAFTGTSLAGATTFAVNAGTLTPGPVTGNVALTKSGAGTLNLGPANDFTGTSNLNGGVVIAPVIADVGPSSIGYGGVTLNGGTLRYTGTDPVVTNRAFNANNGTGGGLDIANAGTTFEITSAFPGASTSAVSKFGAGTLIISGTLDNNSLVLNAQAGLTMLNKGGASTSRAVAGISNIAPGATVQLAGTHSDQIYGSNATGNIGGINMTGGTLDLNGKSESVSRLSGSGVVTNHGAAGTTSILTVGEASGTATFSGAITDGVNGGKVGLTKVGAGIANIGASSPGSNTYSGATTISDGTLRIETAPTAPVSGPGLWLDAADASSVVLDGGLVSAWNDKSGNNRNATQANVANQPGYVNNALVDGQGVIDFTAGKFLNVDLGFISGSSYTLFAVEGKQSTASSNYFMGSRGNTTNNALHIGYRTDNTTTFAQYGNDINPAANNALAYTGTQVFRAWSATMSTSSGRAFYIDGVQQGTNTSTATLNTSGGGVIGQGHNTGTQYLGDLGEVLVYNSALSAADRQAVEAYLNSKWFGVGATQSVLPANTAVNITASGAVLDINGSTETIASLAGVAGSSVTLGAGQLTVGGADTTTFAGTISSSGAPAVSLVKAGPGTLILSGANTHTGATVVEGGELIVTGSLTGATIIDSPAAILSGTGTVGNVTLTDGTLTAGNASINALATGNLILSGGTALFDLAADGSSDVLNVTGTVNLAAPVQLALSFNSPLIQQTVFTLFANDSGDAFDFTGGGGFFAGATPIVPGQSFSYTSNGFTEHFEASFTGGDGNDLALTVVPEPSAALSLLGGLGLLVACRRGRRRSA